MNNVSSISSFKAVMSKFAESKWCDRLGIVIVFASAYFSGYLFELLNQVHDFGPWSHYVPFGLISVGSALLSLYSNRLTARLDNLGNQIGLLGVVVSGSIDYLLGNHAAIYTYPITFVIQYVAIRVWMKSDKFKARKPLTGIKGYGLTAIILVTTFVFSYGINSLGFPEHTWLFYVTTVVFALSIAANIMNAMKLTVQWNYWGVYNVVQLAKALIQGNYANVGKYLYYIGVSVAGLIFWHDRQA